MRNIFLIEDHDEALKIWRKKNIRGLDLVHCDAHIDFGFHQARPIDKVINEARSVKELKEKLEYSLSFLHYQKDFNKQTNIGNYIYPAMEEGIVQNFYWVVPGRAKEFGDSKKAIKDILKGIAKRQGDKKVSLRYDGNGAVSTNYFGRNITVCNLDNLPVLSNDAILDIDTDFLVIDTAANADSTKNIGRRSPWISPKELIDALKAKIKKPKITTIAYSTDGGWTPMEYKYLADEMAYNLQPSRFRSRFEISRAAASYFNLFNSTGKKEFYKKAIGLNPAYRLIDNNFGPLYLLSRKLSLARKEFKRILKVDNKNPASLFGLGVIALKRKEFARAKRHFNSASRFIGNNRLFAMTKKQILFELGKAEFYLKNFKRAKELFLSYKSIFPLEPQSYYFLGLIFEKEKEFPKAAAFYKDAVRLDFGRIEPLFDLLRIARYLKDKDRVVQYIIAKHRVFKKELKGLEKSGKKKKKIKGLIGMRNKILILEKRLTDLRRR